MLSRDTQFRDIEIERLIPDKGKRILSLSVQLISSGSTGDSLFLLFMEDITIRKKAEKERIELLRIAEESKAEADKASRAKDLFLATLSHELRTPLTSLMLQVQLLRRGKTDPERILHACGVIERSAITQSQLIEDLLDISRIVTGKLWLNMGAIDLSVVVDGAITTVSSFAISKDITIVSRLEKFEGRVEGDPIRLQQVIWNLLTNAVKFSPPKSKIVINLKYDKKFATVEVSDEGIGIEAESFSLIFRRFSQVESDISRSHGGLGLGLAIVKHIVEGHGGAVSVTSAGRNLGSTFTISLPLLDPNVAVLGGNEKKMVPNQAQIKDFPELKGRRILIVDDDIETCAALSELLVQIGADARTANSALDAMNILSIFRPDIMICDISMPGENGLTFIRKIRKLSASQGGNIPALALSAMASERDIELALEAGFQLHLAKPVDFDFLSSKLVALI